jgi:RNA polymerase sigma factor (TIGR02999 family)
MSDVNRLIEAAASGEPQAAADLLPLVYTELRNLAAARLAAEPGGQTLQPTALVHEAYLRLVGNGPGPAWNGKGHFFAAAAEAMRRILINRARDKCRLKRSGGRNRIDLDGLTDVAAAAPEDLVDLDDALERLNSAFPQCAALVKLRFFAGLTLDDAATALGIAPRTADRHWAFARAWLFDALGNS